MDRSLAARPEGALAGLMGTVMSRHNAPMTRFGVSLLPLRSDDRVLDIGFGPGHSTKMLAEQVGDGFVAGADISRDIAVIARKRLAGSGRVGLCAASVSALPFTAGTFTKVLASNTVQFWPNLPEDLREIRRVMSPGGRLVLCVRRKGRLGYLDEDLEALCRAVGKAGFSDPGIVVGDAAAAVTADR